MDNLNQPNESTIPYDVVSLPSQGVFYKNNKKSLKVSYLTAADENILTSPNLSDSGELMDTLLQNKIQDKDINVDELAECDKQAIFIFLRNTAFGPEYKFTLTDPTTSKQFEHTEDLSILSTKEITQKADDNGHYEFTLPKSGKKTKLRLLTPKDNSELAELEKSYTNVKVKPMATKRLEKSIVELDGDTDPMSLAVKIHTLPLVDAQEIKKFLTSVEPGLDVVRTTKAPSGAEVRFSINFGLNFFRPFFGL
jgi:hypothetical protein